jgi:hypothetical protein
LRNKPDEGEQLEDDGEDDGFVQVEDSDDHDIEQLEAEDDRSDDSDNKLGQNK